MTTAENPRPRPPADTAERGRTSPGGPPPPPEDPTPQSPPADPPSEAAVHPAPPPRSTAADLPTDVTARLRLIDADLARPFTPGSAPPSGDADFHLAVLAMSRAFWQDRSTETVEAAWAAIGADLAEVASLLSERWGAPAFVDPGPYVDAAVEGAESPSAFVYLYTAVCDLRVWRPPGTGRWVALAVVHDDTELPFILYAAVGADPFPEPPTPPDAAPRLSARPRPLPGL
ncbi:hypothetical protein SUDANB121_03334 [Nocardiopsis dassonvillei]|uniref:hypothetical protein n=1 Tax=Nocardiopsis dassonvillei TaxID=2014 RepID=UPI003F562BD6